MEDTSNKQEVIAPQGENIGQEPPVVDTKTAEIVPPTPPVNDDDFVPKAEIRQRNVKPKDGDAPVVDEKPAEVVPKWKSKGWENEDEIIDRNEVEQLRKTAKTLDEIPEELAAALHLHTKKGVNWKEAWQEIESLVKKVEVPKTEVEGKQVLDKDFIYEDAAKALFLEGIKLEKTQKGRVFDETAAIELFEEAQEKPNRLIETLEDYAEKINESKQKQLDSLFKDIDTGGRKEIKEQQAEFAEREKKYVNYSKEVMETIDKILSDEKDYLTIGDKEKEDIHFFSRTKEDNDIIRQNSEKYLQDTLEGWKKAFGEIPKLDAKMKEGLFEGAKKASIDAFRLANRDKELAAAYQKGQEDNNYMHFKKLGAGATPNIQQPVSQEFIKEQQEKDGWRLDKRTGVLVKAKV